MTVDYYAMGTTLANMVNLETIVATEPFDQSGGRIPSLGSIKERDLSGLTTRSGKLNGALTCQAMTDAERIALNTALFGAQNVDSAELYVSVRGDDNYFNPYLAIVERPYEVDDYQQVITTSTILRLRPLTLRLFNCRLQAVTKTALATLTSSERLVYGNTASGGFTLTLCAASAVQANTVVSIVKTAAANTLTMVRAGSDTINGLTTSLTRTALNARVDLVSDGVSAWVTI